MRLYVIAFMIVAIFFAALVVGSHLYPVTRNYECDIDSTVTVRFDNTSLGMALKRSREIANRINGVNVSNVNCQQAE